MSDTRHTTHAAQGKTRLRQSFLERPETVVHLPNGETMILKRDAESAPMPLFRKLDPKKFDPRSGRPKQGSKGKGKDKQGGTAGGPPTMMPFSKMVMTALVAHQVWGFLRANVPKWWRLLRGAPPPSGELALPQGGAGRVVVQGAWGPEELDEGDLDEEGRLRMVAARKAQAAMARAMVRNAMPKPQHRGLPERMAAAHGARQGPVQSAKQRMRPNKEGVKARSKGKLEKMDDAVKREVKAAVEAARQQMVAQQQQAVMDNMPRLAAPRKLPTVLEGGPSRKPAA